MTDFWLKNSVVHQCRKTSRAIAERSRACVCSRFVVGSWVQFPPGEVFFLDKKKFVFQELDGELS